MYVSAVDGHFIREDFARLAEILEDYDPYLKLHWIPPENRADPDKSRPYAIVDTRSNYVVKYVAETDDPRNVLAEIFDADNKQGDVLKRIDARNAAMEVFKLKEKLELQEERQDRAAWLMATKKNYIRYNGKLLDDQLRPLRSL